MIQQPFIRAFLAFVLVSGFMAAIIALFINSIPTSNEQLLSYMLGQLSGFVAAIVAFDFGSSRASEHKTELLNAAPGDPQQVEVVNTRADPVPTSQMPDPTFGGKL